VPNDWLDELGYERIVPRARLARRAARIAS
jgi:hypothetical protein